MEQGAYSNDLRSRVVAEVAAGTSRWQAARHHWVSASSAVRWAELHDETGRVSPRPRVSQEPLAAGAAYGRGDYTTALRILRPKAAAQLYLGFMYKEGIGVAQNYQRA